MKVGHDSNTVEFIPIDGGFIRKIKVGSLMSQTDTIKLDQEIELSDDTSKHKNLFTLQGVYFHTLYEFNINSF